MATTISRPTLSWSALWDNLNVEDLTYSETVKEQSVDRTGVGMGIALQKSIKFDPSSDKDIRSEDELEGILGARELAEWLCGQTEFVGKVEIHKSSKEFTWENFKGRRGIMFIKQAGVGKKQYVDHIDLWDGRFLKGVDKPWKQFEQVWFWDLWPCATNGTVKVYSKADAKSRSLTSVSHNQHVEVVEVVDENWVKVNLTKYYAVESIGFIPRGSIECQPVPPLPDERKKKRVKWSKLWEYYEEKPCEGGADDQCAIRIGVALKKSGVDLSSFTGATCGRAKPKHDESHILRAEELAKWLSKQTELVGEVKIYDKGNAKITWENFKDRRGIMFIDKPILGREIDHIDLWDGSQLRRGKNEWISVGRWVYFWELE